MNYLYYGDNLEVMRKYIADESVDLCYIDPPFNSKRNYFQIYGGIGDQKDRAQAQAFIDTWQWGERAEEEYREILSSQRRHLEKTIELIKGLRDALGATGFMAYLIAMTVRLNEIWHKIKPDGSFFLHCDPTASHYLKLILDSIFIPRGGDFRNELIWYYTNASRGKKEFAHAHDVVFWYSKGRDWTFNRNEILVPFASSMTKWRYTRGGQAGRGREMPAGKTPDDVIEIPALNAMSKERLGYPTQKPRELMEYIIRAASKEDDVVMDCYCGCGTTVDAAQVLKRRWIGVDITYHSIALVLQRLQRHTKLNALSYQVAGIPKDMESVRALANKQDDRVRKQFEIWAILQFTENSGVPREQKGADRGIDGVVYFYTGKREKIEKAAIQVKSGKVSRRDISQLETDRKNIGAPVAYFITLEEATQPMHQQAVLAGVYENPLFPQHKIPRLQIIQVKSILAGQTIHKTGIIPITTNKEGKPLIINSENRNFNL